MDKSSMSVEAGSRAALYHWFARAFFAPPGEREVLAMTDGEQRPLLDSMAATPGGGQAVALMRQALAAGTPEQAASRIGAAHTRLFDGAGGYENAPPYRSVYESDGLLYQQATGEMERALRQHRLKLTEEVCEPADHLAVQLDAMSQLAQRLAEEAAQPTRALTPLLAEQADFLDRQLLSWIDRFTERVAVCDELGFHAGLTALLSGFLRQDRAYLSERREGGREKGEG